MSNKTETSSISRRDFLKAGLFGTTSALLAGQAHAETVAPKTPPAFPEPVFRVLGRTGLRITVVSFGAMLTPEPEVISIAFDKGVNYVDTARRYMGGRNEEIVAKALKGRRDRVYVATKTLSSSTSKADIIKDVETSLAALGTDYVDVIQLHNLTDRDRIFIAETREGLLKLKKDGKVRFFGITTHKNQAEVLNGLVADADRFFDTALVSYNFKTEKTVEAAIAQAAKAGVGVIAMKTQAGGYATEALAGISPHQAALKWVLRNPNVTAAIPGMKDLAQLKEDIAVMGMPFTHADRRILRLYESAIRPVYCHLCGKCETACPRGVDISSVNRALMYSEGGYKSRELGKKTYDNLSVSAAACTHCDTCSAHCVNNLDIPAKMAVARKLFG